MTDTPRAYRQGITALVPFFKEDGIGQRILYAMAIFVDLLVDLATLGVRARFPGYTTNEPLPYLGRDRVMPRGPNESNTAYAVALRDWHDVLRLLGNPYVLLRQFVRFFQPSPMSAVLVYRNGKRFHTDISGNITRSSGPWDAGDPEQWARWWLVVNWPEPINDDGLWDDAGTWDDGGVWDCDVPPSDVQAVRTIPAWGNSAHSQGRVVLLQGSAELWGEPIGTWGDPGTWGAGSSADLSLE